MGPVPVTNSPSQVFYSLWVAGNPGTLEWRPRPS